VRVRHCSRCSAMKNVNQSTPAWHDRPMES